MHDYVFLTDDCCDLPPEYYRENGIELKRLSFSIDGVESTAEDMSPQEFYALIRNGKTPITSQVSVEQWKNCFEPYLRDGRDLLYVAFSSGLSGTCGSARVAARELAERYAGRRILVVDSLCASLGQGLLVHKANRLRKDGASIEELANWLEENRLRLSHQVAVDDLMHLHRGGRVSRASAVAGSLLGIKPIIHMDNEGKLVPIDKVRGRRQSLRAIVDKTQALVGDTPNDFFMVCHSDCEEDARYVADLASERFQIRDYLIHFIGPVIGSHTGPGTVSLFLMAEHR